VVRPLHRCLSQVSGQTPSPVASRWPDSIASLPSSEPRKIKNTHCRGGYLCSVQGGSTPGGGALVGAQITAVSFVNKVSSAQRVSGQAVVRGLAPVSGQAPTPLFVASQRPDPIASHKSAARPHCQSQVSGQTPLPVTSQRPDPIASRKSVAKPHCRGKTLSL
jgi:hypothetical protein